MRSTTIVRTDRDVRADVLDELAAEPRIRPAGVDVTVDEGVVALRGRVADHPARWAAERAAHRVPRVRAVANDLVVRPPGRPATGPVDPPRPAGPTDPELAAAVVHALEWEAFVPPGRLAVTVSGGWVALRGRVEWEYQRRAAGWAVGRLPGVRGVSDRIMVRP
ncbi:BON domain-containing protein [Micromonospora cathayae]|uniref:BON domain-containing protein n=1 Tax=Micromonospora cathayae TaxID=3028804 RepID=A0ABY7ZNM9_9ACTN|nr:BON domain-containing protein [Micromonospora sp. HUAS 3]WDZ84637.1 BON domain-containing protein [Micromonospora sp. HUAS 3]